MHDLDWEKHPERHPLAAVAERDGVRIFEDVAVTGITRDRGRVTGVSTSRGPIAAEYVVNCAGMWARELGAMSGVNIPNQAAEHYYLITEEIPDLPKNMPVLEDPSHYTYIREEVGGLMVGLFEPVCAPWKIEGVPHDFSFGEIPPDWDRMTPFLEKAMSRVPRTLEVGVKKFFCGPESFTPDLRPIVGEAPEGVEQVGHGVGHRDGLVARVDPHAPSVERVEEGLEDRPLVAEEARLGDSEGDGEALERLDRRRDVPVLVAGEPGLRDARGLLDVGLAEAGAQARLAQALPEGLCVLVHDVLPILPIVFPQGCRTRAS
mgnify:CR=1 FL=1